MRIRISCENEIKMEGQSKKLNLNWSKWLKATTILTFIRHYNFVHLQKMIFDSCRGWVCCLWEGAPIPTKGICIFVQNIIWNTQKIPVETWMAFVRHILTNLKCLTFRDFFSKRLCVPPEKKIKQTCRGHSVTTQVCAALISTVTF